MLRAVSEVAAYIETAWSIGCLYKPHYEYRGRASGPPVANAV